MICHLTCRSISLIAISLMPLVTSCTTTTHGYQNNGLSQVSSFTLGSFDNPSWTKVEVLMTAKPTSLANNIDKSFVKANFQAQSATDVSIKVNYGSYTMNLIYSDDAGNKLFNVCPDFAKAVQKVNQPAVVVTLPICKYNTSTPAGSVASSGGQSSQPGGSGGNASAANLFVDSKMFVNPSFATNVALAGQNTTLNSTAANQLQNVSTAFWVDKIAKVADLDRYLAAAHILVAGGNAHITATVVVYDLPDRDCHALASNGELTVANNGLSQYKSLMDQIAAVFSKYSDVNIAVIIEPDSLPNIVTNLGTPKCAGAQNAYQDGIVYAIQTLNMANTSLYLDSAHAGWLGWANNRAAMAQLVRTVLDRAGGVNMIRGFSSNVANYTPLSVPDPTGMTWYDPTNPAKDELTFVSLIQQDYANAGVTNHNFVIDTSRNGVLNSRTSWGNWCNLSRAGLGQEPTAAPVAGVDAYLWIKVPGESDGTSDSTSPRFDSSCVSSDSATGAPEAGEWFGAEFQSLVNNATM